MKMTAWCALALAALQAGPSAPAGGVARLAGNDADSGTAYVLLSVDGQPVGTAGDAAVPRLTAQCSRGNGGKLKFELLMDEPGQSARPELTYVAPWRPKNDGDLFPPTQRKANVKMEFLGYTKVKPVSRQWTYLDEHPGEMMYSTPGMRSGYMEEISFYLQYLKALPTLRVTVPGKGTAEFATGAWLAAVKAEPLCAASGL